MSDAAAATGQDSGTTRGVIFVWIAILIFASANSIALLMFELGKQHPVDGRNAISFCNVLFIGNAIACATLWGLYRKQWTKENIAALNKSDWGSLLFLAALTGAISPSVIFYALEFSSVTNVVLIGRLEPFVLLGLSSVLLKERPNKWAAIGATVSFVGVCVTFLLQGLDTGFNFGKGDLLAAVGAVLAAIGIVVSKIRLKSIPLGIFAVTRTGIGAVFFFIVATYLFGIEHFQDAFSPFLWQMMLIYGAIIVVGGQYFWFTGLKTAPTSDVSLASSFTPIAAVLFAFLILGERPDMPVIIGGAIIILGIAIGQFGGQIIKITSERLSTTSAMLQTEGRISFRGV